jgi:hypothetical protein
LTHGQGIVDDEYNWHLQEEQLPSLSRLSFDASNGIEKFLFFLV